VVHSHVFTAATIAEILERQGYIDNFHAIHNRISLRLGTRIWDLREEGYEIETIEQPGKNTVYWLIAKPAPKTLAMFNQ
jgi:hypothetical protein